MRVLMVLTPAGIILQVIGGILLGCLCGTALPIVQGIKSDHAPDGAVSGMIARGAAALAGAGVISFLSGWKVLPLMICMAAGFVIADFVLRRALAGTDEKLLEMARVFRIPAVSKLKYILIPQLKGHFEDRKAGDRT